MNNQALVTREGFMVAVEIDPETIRQVISISDDDVLWLKISEAGFHADDTFMAQELNGVILNAKAYWIQWTPGQPPDKIPFRTMDDQPQGYELRCDLKVKLLDGELVGLSLAPSSCRSFSRYARRLTAMRLQLGDVVTIFRTRAVSNKMGQKFSIVDFDFIPPRTDNKPKTVSDVITVSAVEDEIQF
jgi:hypothetical protein